MLCETQNNRKIVVLIGGPAAGKGTQAEKIITDYDFVHISTGEILRHEAEKDVNLAEKIQTGSLISDTYVAKLLHKEISKTDPWKPILLDGFPRTAEQSYLLEAYEPVMAIYIKVSSSVMEKRLRSRGRADDSNLEARRRRIESFFIDTLPVIEYYDFQEILCVVDGDQDVESVYDSIISSCISKIL